MATCAPDARHGRCHGRRTGAPPLATAQAPARLSRLAMRGIHRLAGSTGEKCGLAEHVRSRRPGRRVVTEGGGVGAGRSCPASWRKLVSDAARGSSFPIGTELADQSVRFSAVGQVTLEAMKVGHENWPLLRFCWQNKASPCWMERSVLKE